MAQQAAQNDTLNRIMAALEREPRIDLYRYPIRATIQDGTVILEGAMENIAAKKLALEIARLHGDMPVMNRLRVRAAEPKENGALRDAVVNALLREPVFTHCSVTVRRNGEADPVRQVPEGGDGDIEIHVDTGTVVLTGHVVSLTHRRMAEVLAWWTGGCEAVENRLRVNPPEREEDGELTDAVRMVLEKDPFVHASQLSISAMDGRITLDGYVASREEQKLAVLDAWYVPGVRDVVDHIQARG